jgi:transposase-like protein
MKLHLLLPRVEPDKLEAPKGCPYQGCDGKRVRWHQDVKKAIRDTKYEQVPAQRYQCLKCKRTFRVYPPGVSRAQTSLTRAKG